MGEKAGRGRAEGLAEGGDEGARGGVTGGRRRGGDCGPAGDLFITFLIADDPRFKRIGSNLYTTTNLDIYTAVLGGEVTIDALDSKVKEDKFFSLR